MKNVSLTMTRYIALFSFIAALISKNWPCTFIFYQPQEPDELKRLASRHV